jgi:hypothetical protein
MDEPTVIYYTYAYNDVDGNIIVVHGHINHFNERVLDLLEKKRFTELIQMSIIDRKMLIYRHGKAYHAFTQYIDKLYGGVIAYA